MYRKNLARIVALLTLCCLGSIAQAQTGPNDYDWNTTSGTWSTSAANGLQSDAGPNVVWPGSNTSNAFFESGSGTVTVSGLQNVNNIQFDVAGYTINGGTINLPSSGNAFIYANANATIGSVVSGGAALINQGNATLFLTNSANNFTGGVFVNGGALNFANGALGNNTITFNGGILQWATGNSQDISSTNVINDPSSANINLDTYGNNV